MGLGKRQSLWGSLLPRTLAAPAQETLDLISWGSSLPPLQPPQGYSGKGHNKGCPLLAEGLLGNTLSPQALFSVPLTRTTAPTPLLIPRTPNIEQIHMWFVKNFAIRD